MAIRTIHEAEDIVYRSYMRASAQIPKDDDSKTRDISLTKKLLSMTGNPDKGGHHILVTGSKGKGSTSRLIAALLEQAGYKVGLFTSPHLIDFTERIQVNGKPIPNDDFITIMGDLEEAVSSIAQSLPPEKYLGPMGITLSAALIYFKMQKTDINVIECGRGGRYDDTNVLENEWAVITPIMAEHLGPLGKNTFDIADHKLGIIKEMSKNVFIGRQNPEVMAYINPKLSSSAHIFGRSFRSSAVRMDFSGTHFDVETNLTKYNHLTLPLLGTFQADNASLAIKVCETIFGRQLQQAEIQRAFKTIKWPGRCEIIAENPTVILDGTINAASAVYLSELVQALGASNVASIIAVPEDKDYQGVIEICHTFSTHLIITEPAHSHKKFPKDAAAFAKALNPDAQFKLPFKEALAHARGLHSDLILIVGTQTFIGEVKSDMNHKTDII